MTKIVVIGHCPEGNQTSVTTLAPEVPVISGLLQASSFVKVSVSLLASMTEWEPTGRQVRTSVVLLRDRREVLALLDASVMRGGTIEGEAHHDLAIGGLLLVGGRYSKHPLHDL
jgi:hypothetical protein